MGNQIKIKGTPVNVGDTIKVHYKYKDGEKWKTQIFKGILIAFKGSNENTMFTVRRVTRSKIGVERIFPAESPLLKKVDIVRKTKNRKAKIYYIRNKSEKEIRERLYS